MLLILKKFLLKLLNIFKTMYFELQDIETVKNLQHSAQSLDRFMKKKCLHNCNLTTF